MRLAELEAHWLTRYPGLREHREFFGWEPYPLSRFTALLEAAMPHAAWRTFLDVGCGIGTKCAVAAGYGLAAAGIEREPVYAAVARELGVRVFQADARTWDGYGRQWGIVYVNHPLRDQAAEDAFERWLHSQLSSGTVLAAVNNPRVAPGSWPAVAEGIYVKPAG